MKTRKLTDDEIAQIFAAVKPIFDRNGGDPEATKAEFREAFEEKPCKTRVQEIFFRAIDILAKLQAEKKQEARYTLTQAGEDYIKRMEAQPHENGNSETL